ncbi:MBL fold metallo-hydrolase [Mycolicibacterium komossense]|nr:MBL fold metallo-hydrolase [Mycolicibacterium komossense]
MSTSGAATLVPHTVAQGPGDGPFSVRYRRSLTIDDLMNGTAASGDTTQVWWLGQAGFAIRRDQQVLLVDPYLSDSLATKYAGTVFPHQRLHAAPIAGEDLNSVVAVLHTHAHTDHMDPWTISGLLQSNRPQFVTPLARASIAIERNIPAELLNGIDAGQRVRLGSFSVTAIPAAHEELTRDADGAHHFLGYVIDTGTARIYHSGDCVPYPGQIDILAALDIDVALLPINGRDRHRLANGVPGNFKLSEAVELCSTAGIPAFICHHFGLFDFNTVAPDAVIDELRKGGGGPAWTVPAVGAAFDIVPTNRKAGER